MSIELRRNLKGCQHPRSRLTQEQADLIRERHGEGVSQRQLAREYRISQMTVFRIVVGQSYSTD